MIKPIEELTYYNCGDWIECRTALLEYDDGRIELVTYSDVLTESLEVAEIAA